MYTTEELKRIKREATNNFNYRRKTGRQMVISSSFTNKKKVLFTSKPLKKLEILNPLLEKTNTHIRFKEKIISEYPSKI